MNDQFGGWIIIAGCILAFGISITWLFLPFILIGKLNSITEELRIVADLLRNRRQ